MKREVLLSSRAEEDFRALDKRTRERVREALLRFAADGRGDIKRLRGVKNGPDLYRLRVGNHRVVFDSSTPEIRVTRIIRRSVDYDWL